MTCRSKKIWGSLVANTNMWGRRSLLTELHGSAVARLEGPLPLRPHRSFLQHSESSKIFHYLPVNLPTSLSVPSYLPTEEKHSLDSKNFDSVEKQYPILIHFIEKLKFLIFLGKIFVKMAKASELEVLLAMRGADENNGASMKKILNMAKQRDSSLKMRNVLVTLKRGMRRGYVMGDGAGKYKLAFSEDYPQLQKKSRRLQHSKPKSRRPKSKQSCRKSKLRFQTTTKKVSRARKSLAKAKNFLSQAKTIHSETESHNQERSCAEPEPSCPKPYPSNSCCPNPAKRRHSASPVPSNTEKPSEESPEKQTDGRNTFVPRTSMKRDIILPTLQFPPNGFTPHQCYTIIRNKV